MTNTAFQSFEDALRSFSPQPRRRLIEKTVRNFATQFAPGGELLFIGGENGQPGYSTSGNWEELAGMPDVVIHHQPTNRIFLIQAVTSEGVIDAKRRQELADIFQTSNANLVYVTAFSNRTIMARFFTEIAWGTVVWIANAPEHLIHFNGGRLMGPHNRSATGIPHDPRR